MNQELPDVQAWFRKGRGTKDHIANFHWIVEEVRAFQKAFDFVDYNKLCKALNKISIPDHLICFLRNLYVGQEATVRTLCGTTDWLKIE